MNARKPDVLILGGGVIGLVCALNLLRAGRSVTVLERKTVGAGSSHGNCGTITPSHAPPLSAPGVIQLALKWMSQADAPLYVRPRLDWRLLGWLTRFAARANPTDFRNGLRAKALLLNRSRALLEQLVRDEGLACEFTTGGTMYVFRDARGLEQASRLLGPVRGEGIEIRELDGAATRQLEPALNDSIVGGHYYPNDASLRPERYVAELARVVRSLGGQILESTEVLGFEREGGRISGVLTAQGRLSAREIVMALGAWSPLMARQLGLELPIQPGKGYSITTSNPKLWPRVPMVLKERSVCVTGWNSGYRLGSTMEFSGYDETLNRVRLDALKRAAVEYLREPWGETTVEEWFGWRPMVYDDLPLIGRAPKLDNLWLATGHGMLGVTLSAVTGRLLSELLTGTDPCVDPSLVDPARFS
ncbi:MAG TPA: FAD-dependent oxidoreductase [Solimonas sp.]|nr:FAD-dependent oxidoreductase [Solimonas sp.]